MGGDSIFSQDEDSCSEVDFSLLSSDSPTLLRDNLSAKVVDGTVNGKNGFVCLETGKNSRGPSSTLGFEINNRRRHSVYKEILQNYEELRIRSKNLKEAKEKILSYRPGVWTEKVCGLKLSDYDVPKTTCLILIGPRESGKSSLVNRISKVFEDDKYAPVRAQVSYNSPTGDGTYFLQEYMIPRDSTSICLYDTRSLSGYPNDDDRILNHWMTDGVHHGELVVRNSDNQSLEKILKHRAHKTGYFSLMGRKVNFVVYVANGLMVLKAMENTGALDARYTNMITSTFNSPYLSYKDDKPVLVVTHGDLLSLSDRARVRAHLVELLGIPPTQIFDIPECDDPVTEFTIIEMVRYALEHADRNYTPKIRVIDKVDRASLLLFMILLILGLAMTVALAQNKFVSCHCHARKIHTSGAENKDPVMYQFASSAKHNASGAKQKDPELYQSASSAKHKASGAKHKASGAKHKVPGMEPNIDWYKIRHIW